MTEITSATVLFGTHSGAVQELRRDMQEYAWSYLGTCKKIHHGQHNYYSPSRKNKMDKEKKVRVDIL